MQALAAPGQSVVVVPALHQLAAHPSIAAAVQSSISTHSTAVLVSEDGDVDDDVLPGGVLARHKHVVAGDVLLEHLAASADPLVQMLVRCPRR